MDRYDAAAIEAKWQRVWEDARAFSTPNPDPGRSRRRKSYVLEMLPYPSGTLHMGHVLNYTIGDVLTHFRRRNGCAVLRPMGYDSFGLPAENAAIREGGHPREIIERNIADDPRADEAARLGDRLGPRGLAPTSPTYYRWTQWLFLKLLRARPRLPEGGAGELVPERPDGARERAGRSTATASAAAAEVEARKLEQWFFRITAYADELLEYELPPGVDWPERIDGDAAQLDRPLRGGRGHSSGSTSSTSTSPSSRRGPTRCSARRSSCSRPSIRWSSRSRATEDDARATRRLTAAKRGEERAAEEEKTGVFTGFYATNPVNGEQIPIWVADYVLMDYGTGAIMAVPAHDERDYEFARDVRPAGARSSSPRR